MLHEVVSLFHGVSLILLFASPTSGLTYTSHTETYLQQLAQQYTSCYSYSCAWTCTGWGCYRRCAFRETCRQCSVLTRYYQEVRTRCQQYWTGPQCNIPYCTQKCPTGQTCVEGNKCQCLTAGQTKCRAERCLNPPRSCYPGTCGPTGNVCACPPQFTGTNCETFLQTPEISECQVKLFSGSPEVEVASANCAVERQEPETTWVSKGSFSRIEASWEAKYLYPYDPVPPAETNHIKDARLGVTNTKASVTITASSSPINKDITPVCKASGSTPEAFVDCKRRSIVWSEFGRTSIPTNSTLETVVSSSLGGYKILHAGDRREAITGQGSTERKVLFKVDTNRPVHCRQTGSCEAPAISVALDAVQNPVVDLEFPNWFDFESGIKSYDVEIYELLKSTSSGETILVRAQTAKDRISIGGDLNKTQYTFPSPGVYSVELTVYDNANNPSKARKIMIYERENHMRISETHLLKIDQASEESGYRWITRLRNESDGLSRLTLSWKGRYSNPKHLNDGWLSRVQPWNVDGGIDDNSKDGGNRTIHEVVHGNGTAFFRLAFKVDDQGGLDLRPRDFKDGNNLNDTDELPESTWMGLNPRLTSKELVMPTLTPRDTVVIWVQAYDIAGHPKEEQILVRCDTTQPEIDSNTPAVLRQNSPDPYKSSVVIKAKDLESGIDEVRYYIIDASLNVNVTSGNVKTTKLRRAGVAGRQGASVCNPGSDADCYCINGGECFENVVIVVIDHCVIDKYYADDKTMQFRYEVVNQAGQSVKPRAPLVIRFDGGKPNCRPVVLFTVGTILAIVIGLLILIILVVLVMLMLVRWKHNKHPLPDRVRSFATSVRLRVTNTEKVHDSEGRVIYRTKTRHVRLAEDDEDIYVDGRDPGGWRVNRDQVEMGDILAQGKFAIVKKAYLKKEGETKAVAAKFLPIGASDSDRALLKAKIAFHGNRVPPHDNIVRLFGVIDDGPVMLFEFCDLTLKDWLSKVEKVDSDVLEILINFAMHIASGMEHLHSKRVVHRRLAVRNVLVKKDGLNGLVAKLIGFGTFSDTGSDEEAAESSVAVPLKWLAPETLESVSKGKPVYTEKSDAWAYGVTVWEIYSLGATPYPGKKSADVEAVLKTGHRMSRPNDCPLELFDAVVTPCWNETPKKRPDFKTIGKQIRNFHSGGANQDGYYAVNPKKEYDDPKERTSDYASSKRAKESVVEELYDDTRH